MQRLILGLISVGMLVGGICLNLRDTGDFTSNTLAPMAIRVGILLGVLWLALPQVFDVLQRVSAHTLICVGIGVMTLVIRPRILLYVAPFLLVAMGLQFVSRLMRGPNTRRRPGRRSATQATLTRNTGPRDTPTGRSSPPAISESRNGSDG